MPARRLWWWLAAALIVVAAALVAVAYRNATAEPLVRRLSVEVPDYPPTAPPVRIILFSDLHVHGPDMPPSRVERLVQQINDLHPDIVVGSGDFVGNNWIGHDYSVAEAVGPLRGLRARFGVFAVLGNIDYRVGADDVVQALEAAGVRVLRNDASPAGPIALGGMDGRLYNRRRLLEARQSTYDAIVNTPGVKVLVAHRPDEFVAAPQSISLVLAGHTHCGQIVLPFIGPLETGSDYGRKFACGVYRRGSTLLVVTAGLGTSYVPLRIGAPPDLWVITLRGAGITSAAFQ